MERKMTKFPVYIFTFKKNEISEREEKNLKVKSSINLSLLKKYNQEKLTIKRLILPSVEKDESISVMFSLRQLPCLLYLDFFALSILEDRIYSLKQENLTEILRGRSKLHRIHTYYGGVVDYHKLNRTFNLNTEDEFLGTGVNVRNWVKKKTGITLPDNRKTEFKISFHIDTNYPYVLFKKNDQRDFIKTADRLSRGDRKNLILSYNYDYYSKLKRGDAKELSLG